MLNTPKRVISPQVAAILTPEARRALVAEGYLMPMAGGSPDLDVAQPDPMGVTQDATTGLITVDDYTNPPAVIPEILRGFVMANEGYWIENVFRTPGMTVNSGFIRYSENHAEDAFLPAGASIAPRSPGSEAPRLGTTRRAPKFAVPESWSGSIEVTDEHRRWNDVIAVEQTFRQAANTFADTLQSRGEAVLSDFVDATSRFVTDAPGSDWTSAHRIEDSVSTAELPSQEFARVRKLFLAEKVGVQPDVMLTSLDDAEELDRIYGDRLDAVLRRYGLTMIASPRRQSGRRLYLKRGQVGVIAFDKPLGTPEYVREGVRFTDVYVMEVVPVFIANGADSILEVRAA